jgi:hypothetical protein
MLVTESAEPSVTTLDCVSAAPMEENSIQPSMLYSVLPTVVSSRLPTIPSLRQSLVDIRGRTSCSKSDTVIELPQPETPPPGYSSMPPSGSITPHRLSAALGGAELDFADDESEGQGSSRAMPLQTFGVEETHSGIRWKYASLGTTLLNQACRESSASTSNSDEASATLTRQLYIHGMTYLLRGLPTKLTPEETLSLQAALPQDLVEAVSDPNAGALIRASQQSLSDPQKPPQNPTILHRVTATLVLQTFLLIQFLLPYIRLFLAHAYRFERKHQITKRLVNTSVATVDDIGRRTLRFSQTVCQMNDGMVGQAINEMSIWWITGVTGGVRQGLAEGLRTIKVAEAQRREGSEVTN